VYDCILPNLKIQYNNNNNGHYIAEIRFLPGALTRPESLSHPQVYPLRNEGNAANEWS